MKKLLTTTALAAAIGCAAVLPMATHAADDAPARSAEIERKPGATMTPDRLYMEAHEADRKRLNEALKPGQDAAAYRRVIADMGYTITAVNDQEDDYLEYEIVKGRNSLEVQVELEKGRGTEIDVVPNMWQAESTEAALEGRKVEAVKSADYSDRSRMGAWNDEREQLEASLPKGQTKKFYDDKLRSMGYQVTAVNEASGEDLEYEVVKGSNSYEVQFEFDDGQPQASDVEVRPNLWKADATEQAMARRN